MMVYGERKLPTRDTKRTKRRTASGAEEYGVEGRAESGIRVVAGIVMDDGTDNGIK